MAVVRYGHEGLVQTSDWSPPGLRADPTGAGLSSRSALRRRTGQSRPVPGPAPDGIASFRLTDSAYQNTVCHRGRHEAPDVVLLDALTLPHLLFRGPTPAGWFVMDPQAAAPAVSDAAPSSCRASPLDCSAGS